MSSRRGLSQKLLTAVVCLTVSAIESARILVVLPVKAPSHHIVIHPILNALEQAGHQLVVYTVVPVHNPPHNITVHLLELEERNDTTIDEVLEIPRWKCFDSLLYSEMIHRVFENNKIKNLLRSKETFDLVITELFFHQESTLAFGYIFNAPIIVVSTTITTFAPNVYLGNSLSVSSIPAGCMSHSDRMTFAERLLNVICHVRANYLHYNSYVPAVEQKMKSYFPKLPPFSELAKKVSLAFINDHMTADYAQPRPPNMIPVGGIHIGAEKPLPQDLKMFMDGAPQGVLVFSLGTVLPDNIKPKEYFDMFISVFRTLNQRVIWKSTKERIGGLPNNVKLVKWMPQRDVLAHPNCVLFITHGGLSSQHEAIYNEVPVVGIPHFGDQFRNVEFYCAKGVGLSILPEDLSVETLTLAVSTVISNSTYRENMKKLSRIFKDRPMTPAETVVFWTEYVLRHGGAAHLKPASNQLSWYQLAVLDVMAAILILIICIFGILYISVKKVFRIYKPFYC